MVSKFQKIQLLSFIFIVVVGCFSENKNQKLQHFDDLFIGDPQSIEINLVALLPEAKALEDKSIYLQILTQIALAQAMQKKFHDAHETLDNADSEITSDYNLAKVRSLLERGRVFHQSDNLTMALKFFKESYFLSKEYGFDYHTINAAHMIAIVEKDVKSKIRWNKIAIDLAEKTKEKNAQRWMEALYNNLAQNYIDAHQYEDSLVAFQSSKKYAKKNNNEIIERSARWGIARSLRSLGQEEQAFKIQSDLLKEYKEMEAEKRLPQEMLRVALGLIYEELAYLHKSFTKKYAQLAYDALSQDPWSVKLIHDRIDDLDKMRKKVN